MRSEGFALLVDSVLVVKQKVKCRETGPFNVLDVVNILKSFAEQVARARHCLHADFIYFVRAAPLHQVVSEPSLDLGAAQELRPDFESVKFVKTQTWQMLLVAIVLANSLLGPPSQTRTVLHKYLKQLIYIEHGLMHFVASLLVKPVGCLRRHKLINLHLKLLNVLHQRQQNQVRLLHEHGVALCVQFKLLEFSALLNLIFKVNQFFERVEEKYDFFG